MAGRTRYPGLPYTEIPPLYKTWRIAEAVLRSRTRLVADRRCAHRLGPLQCGVIVPVMSAVMKLWRLPLTMQAGDLRVLLSLREGIFEKSSRGTR